MKKKAERAAFIAQRLQALYPQPPIPLQHNSTFELLVAVLLSAQCTDARVNLVTPALFARANTAQAMAGVPVPEIQEMIRTCGLAPKKAQAISGLSKILVEQYGGEVPADMAALETLPGVGHKTASVVMSQGFGEPAFPVDTHIHRLAQRWGLSNGKDVVQTERDLKRLFPRESWNDLHLQIIYYGREFCSARGCDGTVCDICRTCYPERIRAKKTRKA
jgi:endonuclease III